MCDFFWRWSMTFMMQPLERSLFVRRRRIHVETDAVIDESRRNGEVEFHEPCYALIKLSSERLNYSSLRWRQVIGSTWSLPSSSLSCTHRCLRTRKIIYSRRPSDHLTRQRNIANQSARVLLRTRNLFCISNRESEGSPKINHCSLCSWINHRRIKTKDVFLVESRRPLVKSLIKNDVCSFLLHNLRAFSEDRGLGQDVSLQIHQVLAAIGHHGQWNWHAHEHANFHSSQINASLWKLGSLRRSAVPLVYCVSTATMPRSVLLFWLCWESMPKMVTIVFDYVPENRSKTEMLPVCLAITASAICRASGLQPLLRLALTLDRRHAKLQKLSIAVVRNLTQTSRRTTATIERETRSFSSMNGSREISQSCNVDDDCPRHSGRGVPHG